MRTFQYGLAGLALAAAAWTAQAAPPAPSNGPAARPPAPRAAPLADADLADAAGGQAIAITDQQLTALNTGNSVTAGGSVVNGPVSISPNAFSGFSGLGNFVINTGNNNNLQGTMSVNIVITPAP